MDKHTETMTEVEFAKAVGVSRVTLWRLRAKGLLPHYKIGTRILYSKQHIEQFLKSHEQGAKQQAK